MTRCSMQYLQAQLFDVPRLSVYGIKVAALFPVRTEVYSRSTLDHQRYTGPEILQLVPDVAFIGMPVDSGEMVVGVGEFLKGCPLTPRIVVGVCRRAVTWKTDQWKQYQIRTVFLHDEDELAGWQAVEQYLLGEHYPLPLGVPTTCLQKLRGRSVAFMCSRQPSALPIAA